MGTGEIVGILFLAAAYVIVIAVLAVFVVRSVKNVFRTKKVNIGLGGLVCALFTSVLFLQISLNCAMFGKDGDMTVAGLAVKIISQTFQFFTLDAAYVDIIEAGKLAFTYGWTVGLYSALALILCVAAPISAGFAVFSILCHFIPKLNLFFHGIMNNMLVFSELNERSIDIAESITEEKVRIYNSRAERASNGIWQKLRRSTIIFTDVYTDRDQEKSAELRDRAKAIGAICLPDDVLTLKLRWWIKAGRKVIYFLIDDDEKNNVDSAISLITDKNGLWKKTSADGKKKFFKTDDAEFYVFSRDAETNEIAEKTLKTLREDKTYGYTFKNVILKTFDQYKNLVYKLIDGNAATLAAGNRPYEFNSYPLYWCKTGENGASADRDLNVLIVGSGIIATEFFKAAYWCGQMCADADPINSTPKFTPAGLNIKVISEEADKFERKMRFLLAGEDFSGDPAKLSMCKAEFVCATFGTAEKDGGGFYSVLNDVYLQKTDYVLVALGDDDLNIEAANWLKRRIDRANIACGRKNTPINFVIENDRMLSSLRHSIKKEGGGCILNPFASFSQQFHISNIFVTEADNKGYLVHMQYGMSSEVPREAALADFLSDSYNRDSSIASALHLPYKIALLPNVADKDFSIDAYSEYFCWLEHRRWVAYTRTLGYRCPTAKEFLSYCVTERTESGYTAKSHKNDDLRLHPCLVEAEKRKKKLQPGLLLGYEQDPEGYLRELCRKIEEEIAGGFLGLTNWLESSIKFTDDENYDPLDRLDMFMILGGNPRNFKEYDVALASSVYRDALRSAILNELFGKCNGFANGDKVAAKTPATVQKLMDETDKQHAAAAESEAAANKKLAEQRAAAEQLEAGAGARKAELEELNKSGKADGNAEKDDVRLQEIEKELKKVNKKISSLLNSVKKSQAEKSAVASPFPEPEAKDAENAKPSLKKKFAAVYLKKYLYTDMLLIRTEQGADPEDLAAAMRGRTRIYRFFEDGMWKLDHAGLVQARSHAVIFPRCESDGCIYALVCLPSGSGLRLRLNVGGEEKTVTLGTGENDFRQNIPVFE